MSTNPVLNSDQKAALKAIKEFLEHPSINVFILKGYAGTGKTFLMQQVGKWLKEKEYSFSLLASTGRAANVLKGKTGFEAKTVHGELYNFNKVDGINDEMFQNSSNNNIGQMSLQFLMRQADEGKMLYIVDEASMLSGDLSKDTLFATFGSGILLNDFFEVVGKNKVIFVGDPCQLPPVNQSFSPALDVNWLTQHDRVAVSFTLKKIERISQSNDILKLAGIVRDMSEEKSWEFYPKLPASNFNNVKLHSTEDALLEQYLKKYSDTGTNKTLAIARSNDTVQKINRAMRHNRYGNAHLPLQEGEVLLVTQNNYAVPLTNGDFIIVSKLGSISYKESLRFQNVSVKSVTTDKEYNLLLSLDCLDSIKGSLTTNQNKALMIDFSYRMRAKNINVNTPAYKKAMMEDDYINCLKVTYGYAVTCHKAQGGEWDNVFLFLDNGMYGMHPLELRKWWYTAITRAREELHIENNKWRIK